MCVGYGEQMWARWRLECRWHVYGSSGGAHTAAAVAALVPRIQLILGVGVLRLPAPPVQLSGARFARLSIDAG